MKSVENHEFYRSLLRSLRPFGTVLAALIFAYALAGMPLPIDTAADFAVPARQIATVLCVGAVGMLLGVWIGGRGAPKETVSTKYGPPFK